MRPVRVEVEGFSAYRKLVTVDFTDVDFFSLTGPTGSGKSSLIDAMVFALFGRVPRLGGNAVAPAITAGADRARVRLDFEVGEEGYCAVRMAQRTSTGGASVKEARLQRGDQVIADGADDVTQAVETVSAQRGLRESLSHLNARVMPQPRMLLMQAGDRFDEEGNLTDDETRDRLARFVTAAAEWARLVGGAS